MLDPLEESKHSAPNLYASDSMPNNFHGNWIWQLHHNGFGLITLSSFIPLITLLAILNFIDGVHLSSRHSNILPWWGSIPRSLDQIPSSITRHVSDNQSKASQIYFYISGFPNKEIAYENDKKYELNMSDDGHFEFYDVWENGVIYSLAYGRNGFSTKFSYRNNKWSIFPKKMPTCLYQELYFNFLSWLNSLINKCHLID